MNIRRQPSSNFGRRERDGQAPTASPSPTKISVRGGVSIFWHLALSCLLLAVAIAAFWTKTGIERLNAETTQTEQKVIEIVNQPITRLPRSGRVTVFSPGWFHAGAVRPDFNTVDIRTTQELLYTGHVTSDVNPAEMFVGSELEFNAMTKYFYRDLTLPKRKLSDAEMVRVNDLYRMIGRDEGVKTWRWLALGGLVALGFCLAYALFLLIRRTQQLPVN